MREMHEHPFNLDVSFPTQEANKADGIEQPGTWPHRQSFEYYNYVLVDYISKRGLYKPSPLSERSLAVTELGCAEAYTINALLSFFNGVGLGQLDTYVHYTGIDIKDQDIQKARARISTNMHYGLVGKNIDLRVADATKPALLPKSDVIIVRHPDIVYNNQKSSNILRAGYDRMADDGIMIVTTFDNNEIDAVNLLFAQQVCLTDKTRAPDTTYGDQYISIIQK